MGGLTVDHGDGTQETPEITGQHYDEFLLTQAVNCTRTIVLEGHLVTYCLLEVPAGTRLVRSYLNKVTENDNNATANERPFALALYQ